MFHASCCLLAGSVSSACFAQSSTEPGIIVEGRRAPMLASQRSVSGEDLLAYGAATVGELVEEVAAEDGDRGDSVTVLVNGRRVSGLGDIESYPAEAIERVELLARESGAAVGAPAGRRVYNVVLKPETRLLVARGRLRGATDGGAIGATADISATRIRRPQRLNAAFEVRHDGAILESERQIEQVDGSPENLGRFRTLRPKTSGYLLSLSGSDQLLPWLDGSATLKVRQNRSQAGLGLSLSGDGVERLSRGSTIDLNTQLNAQTGSWSFSLDGGLRRDWRQITTDLSPMPSRNRIVTHSTRAELLAHGPVWTMPAGPLHLTLAAGLRLERVESRGLGDRMEFGRTSRDIRLGVDVPILSESGPIPWLGSLAVRAEAGEGSTSGAGKLRSRIVSLRWSPARWIQLSAVHNDVRNAPGVDLLTDPLIETSGVRYFDPLRQETVELVTRTGGRFELPVQASTTRKLSADLRPLKDVDLLLTVEYGTAVNSNVISVLPAASALVFELFPERFERNPAGQLTGVDLRPVIFPSQREEQFHTSFNLNVPLDIGGGRSRLQFSGSYRPLLSSRLALGRNFGTIDLLEPGSIALGGSTRPRDQFDFTVGYSEPGLGVRFSGERRSRSVLQAGGPADVLTFSPLTTFGLRGFIEGRRFVASSSLLRNSRIGIDIDNVLNKRERVSDGQGRTPLSYQSAIRDPVGRNIQIEFRKTF
ncbi:hypothetical protein [Croceicoccus sp. BE223]|uniref:hypothetical protein n=1 Tax=Croceicoccus sp. BE223 TaxID=2817716 RepID=UPI002858B60A|nr:hypothetical protein [Croceicoccus sp. BE223]MDR7102877.1 hypothetical protein [Croceicoccus sp. BE223]